MPHSTGRIAHTMVFVTPVVELAGTSNSQMESQRDVTIKMASTYTIKSVNVIRGVGKNV